MDKKSIEGKDVFQCATHFLLTISIQCQEITLWELIKWSPKRKCFDLLSNSFNSFFKKKVEKTSSLENLYRVFSLTWPASTQIYWKKESVCIRKEFNSQRIGLGHQQGRRFIVLGHQYGRRDVVWKHSIWILGLRWPEAPVTKETDSYKQTHSGWRF